MAKILILGDVMLDKYSYGSVQRLNPEGPNPLLNIQKEELKLGGAANVAANAASLSGDSDLVSIIGNDFNGQTLNALIKEANIKYHNICNDFPTITKQRFIESTYNQQMLRVDYEEKIKLDTTQKKQITDLIQENGYQYLIISDYNKGILDQELFLNIKDIADKKGIKMLIDAKPKNYSYIDNVFLLKPNFKEFCEMVGETFANTDENIEKYAIPLMKQKQSNIVVTRGEKGASLIELSGTITHIPTHAKQVFDVTGAGDTFIATVTWALSQGNSLIKSIELGNKASGTVVAKVGTAVITLDELNL